MSAPDCMHARVTFLYMCLVVLYAIRSVLQCERSMNADMSNEGGDTCSNEMVDSVDDHSITWHFEASI